jgi:aspartate/methionine/tyrosine aminotransferase
MTIDRNFQVSSPPRPRPNPLLVATAAPPIPAAQRWRAGYGGRLGPLIDLAQAVPGTPPPDALLERLGEAARRPGTASYGPILGDTALREALAGDIGAVYGGPVSAEEIAITAGCNQAFFVAMMALARPGDEVILPTPWYFNHKMTLDMLGITARPLPCHASNGFVPSPDEARALIGPTTRAIVLVTPNNPTGATYPAETLRAFQALAREAGLALVLDETYRDFLPPGQDRPHDLFARPDWQASTLQLYSFSKSFAVPGHRVGALIADRGLLEEVTKILDCLMICPPRAAQAALAWAVEGTRDWREEVRATINRRAALFAGVIAGAPGWSISAMGAYFAYVRHPLEMSSEDAAATLAGRAGVVTLPGSFFGAGEDGHLRFAVANVDEGRIASVGERLAALA